MNADPIEDLLLSADDSAPKLELQPPRLVDLERKRRLRIVRRAGVLLSVAILVTTALWATALRDRRRAELLVSSTQSLTSSLAELGGALDALREPTESKPSSASEDAAMATFRALHRGAERGDPSSIENLRWLAQRFPTTRGGRCAQLFLNTDDVRPNELQSSGPSANIHETQR